MTVNNGGKTKTVLTRWLVFNFVGILGIAVQLGALHLLVSCMHYIPATGLAVEAAVLHNFIWHERWTWADRRTPGLRNILRRLILFHLANGLVSIAGNLLLTTFFVEAFKWNYLSANMAAITICSLLNFWAGDQMVFRRRDDDSGNSARTECPLTRRNKL